MGWFVGRGRNLERKRPPRWTAPVPEIVWKDTAWGFDWLASLCLGHGGMMVPVSP